MWNRQWLRVVLGGEVVRLERGPGFVLTLIVWHKLSFEKDLRTDGRTTVRVGRRNRPRPSNTHGTFRRDLSFLKVVRGEDLNLRSQWLLGVPP